MMRFSEKLIKLRKENGLSQEELGYKIDVSRQAVSKWESDQSNPDIEKIIEISNLFNVSTDYLLKDEIKEPVSKNEPVKPKKKKRKLLIILGIVLLIYIITVVYKFIVLTVLYNIANSFSEENYWMSKDLEMHSSLNDTHLYMNFDITKENNTYLCTVCNSNNKEIDYETPYELLYINSETNTAYRLYYDQEVKKYRYFELDEDINYYLEKNDIKEETLSCIPDNKILFSLNPLNFVSLRSRYIKSISFQDGTKFVDSAYFDDIGLINNVISSSDHLMQMTQYSYDYVPDHFNDKIISPVEDENFKEKIIFNSNAEDDNS